MERGVGVPEADARAGLIAVMRWTHGRAADGSMISLSPGSSMRSIASAGSTHSRLRTSRSGQSSAATVTCRMKTRTWWVRPYFS